MPTRPFSIALAAIVLIIVVAATMDYINTANRVHVAVPGPVPATATPVDARAACQDAVRARVTGFVGFDSATASQFPDENTWTVFGTVQAHSHTGSLAHYAFSCEGMWIDRGRWSLPAVTVDPNGR